ncbi:MAG: hypothetical protein AAFN17_14895 [Pseudomonadota bacterium]
MNLPKRQTLGLAAVLCVSLPAMAFAYHPSCAGGRVIYQDQCISQGEYSIITDSGAAAMHICPASNEQANTVQYDYLTVWGGQYRYVCSHYHHCSQVQAADPSSYSKFCD